MSAKVQFKVPTFATSFFFQILSYVAPSSGWGILGAFPSLIRSTASTWGKKTTSLNINIFRSPLELRVVRKFWSRQLSCQSKRPPLEKLASTKDASLYGGWGHALPEYFYIQTLWNVVFCNLQAIFSPKLLKIWSELPSEGIKFNYKWHKNTCYSFQEMFLYQSSDILFKKRHP